MLGMVGARRSGRGGGLGCLGQITSASSRAFLVLGEHGGGGGISVAGAAEDEAADDEAAPAADVPLFNHCTERGFALAGIELSGAGASTGSCPASAVR